MEEENGIVDLGDRIFIPSEIDVGTVFGKITSVSRTLAVDVSEVSETSFTFKPVDGQHFLTSEGGIEFQFSDGDGGKVQFCIIANGTIAGGRFGKNYWQFWMGSGRVIEDAIWNDLLEDVADAYGN